MKVYSGSDIGLVRKENQDDFLVKQLSEDEIFTVVCDGMGGEKKGEIASKIAVNDIWEIFSNSYQKDLADEKIKNIIISAISHSNEKIYQISNESTDCTGMGTTVVASLIKKNKLHVAYAGDSRAYLLSNHSITQLTKDHSLVQQMCDFGEITKDEMRNHPRKNIITRAIGVAENIKVDYFEHDFTQQDKLLICTDGLSNQLTDEEILKISTDNNSDTANELILEAKKNGGKDNITVVVIENI